MPVEVGIGRREGRGYGHAAVFSECKPPFAIGVLWEITASTNLSLQTTSLSDFVCWPFDYNSQSCSRSLHTSPDGFIDTDNSCIWIWSIKGVRAHVPPCRLYYPMHTLLCLEQAKTANNSLGWMNGRCYTKIGCQSASVISVSLSLCAIKMLTLGCVRGDTRFEL